MMKPRLSKRAHGSPISMAAAGICIAIGAYIAKVSWAGDLPSATILFALGIIIVICAILSFLPI